MDNYDPSKTDNRKKIMNNIVFFSTPKPWLGHINVIQRNAIRNWLRQKPHAIVLFGDEEGTAEICAEFGLIHHPELKRTEYGTPIISEVFNDIHKTTKPEDILVYINTDILFSKDGAFLETMRSCNACLPEYLAITGRSHCEYKKELITEADWESHYRFAETHIPEWHYGVDVFAFRHGFVKNMPSFALGRGKWDTWIVGDTRTRGLPLVDLSESVYTFHQAHDYTHLPESVAKHKAWGPEGYRWEEFKTKGIETDKNIQMLKNSAVQTQKAAFVKQCTHVMRHGRCYSGIQRLEMQWKDTLNLKNGDPVIVIRSAPRDTMLPVLSSLHNVGARIQLVVQSDVSEQYADLYDIQYAINSGPLEPKSISANIASQLKGIGPVMALIVYHNNFGDAYINIHKTVNAIGLECPVIGVTPTGWLCNE